MIEKPRFGGVFLWAKTFNEEVFASNAMNCVQAKDAMAQAADMAASPCDPEYPLFRLKEDASVERLGHLECLAGDTFKVHLTPERPNLAKCPEGDAFPGLPWYLDELRPQGFLGRLGAKRHCQPDLDDAPPKTLLRHLAITGGTGVGDILLGEPALAAALNALDHPPDAVPATGANAAYRERARHVMGGQLAPSGPGGEQPKFTATVEHDGGRYAALVKFALPGAGEAAERWADLLVCEHIALETLRDHGVRAAASSLIQTERHTFLEVQRFDRTPGSLGRRGFASLLALSAAFVGDVAADWGQVGEQLLAQRWIEQETADGMGRLHAFGRLIGNTDMHQGNIGFDRVDRGPLMLAPAYDMLPMSLAPSRNGVLRATNPINPVAPLRAAQLAHLQWAAPLAVAYWERVAASPLMRSDVLRQVAVQNAERVRGMGKRFG